MQLLAQYIATAFIGWERDMNTNDMMAEIRDANLGYLMLAQQMIRSDKAAAIFRLGISQEIANLIEGLIMVRY